MRQIYLLSYLNSMLRGYVGGPGNYGIESFFSSSICTFCHWLLCSDGKDITLPRKVLVKGRFMIITRRFPQVSFIKTERYVCNLEFSLSALDRLPRAPYFLRVIASFSCNNSSIHYFTISSKGKISAKIRKTCMAYYCIYHDLPCLHCRDQSNLFPYYSH